MKIAINGFGRIGRVAYRVLHERGLDKDVIAVNDLTDAGTLAHLLEYDSNYGRLSTPVKSHSYERKDPYAGALIVGEHSFYVLSVKDPAQLPWKALGVDVVIESTGRFTTPEDMKKHLDAGAKKVVLSAPVEGEGVETIVHGVNDEAVMGNNPTMLANASCTTNCISPIAKVILQKFGVEKAMMTTIHSYTQDQMLQDGPHKDLRRARAAAENIVPTTTGATKAAAKAIPELEGIFHGLSIRVPTSVGSLSDFTFVTKKATTKEEVNAALKEAAEQGGLKGFIEFTEAPLVSKDIVRNPASAIVDASLTQVVGGTLVKVVAWYDNEWGYSNRLIDVVTALGEAHNSVVPSAEKPMPTVEVTHQEAKLDPKPSESHSPEAKPSEPAETSPLVEHNAVKSSDSPAKPEPNPVTRTVPIVNPMKTNPAPIAPGAAHTDQSHEILHQPAEAPPVEMEKPVDVPPPHEIPPAPVAEDAKPTMAIPNPIKPDSGTEPVTHMDHAPVHVTVHQPLNHTPAPTSTALPNRDLNS